MTLNRAAPSCCTSMTAAAPSGSWARPRWAHAPGVHAKLTCFYCIWLHKTLYVLFKMALFGQVKDVFVNFTRFSPTDLLFLSFSSETYLLLSSLQFNCLFPVKPWAPECPAGRSASGSPTRVLPADMNMTVCRLILLQGRGGTLLPSGLNLTSSILQIQVDETIS